MLRYENMGYEELFNLGFKNFMEYYASLSDEDIKNKYGWYQDAYEYTIRKRSLSIKFLQIMKNENLTLSFSPNSSSCYIHKEDEEITWGHKPENSYRLADHWNWKEYDSYNNKYITHCPAEVEDRDELYICKWVDGKYMKIL